MNRYAELFQRHQQEVNALPIGFAFGNRQFEEMMQGWGLDPEKDLDKIYRLGSTGGYYKKSDAQLIRDTFSRHEAEQAFKAALAEVSDPETRNLIDMAVGKISRAYQILGFCAGHFSQDSRARFF